jgi:uncharacterized membrane protein YGL010W
MKLLADTVKVNVAIHIACVPVILVTAFLLVSCASRIKVLAY